MADYFEAEFNDNALDTEFFPAFLDAAGTPWFEAGDTFQADLKVSADDVPVVASLTNANGGIDVTYVADGVIGLKPMVVAIAPGTYVTDIILDPAGNRQTAYIGKIIILKGVTA